VTITRLGRPTAVLVPVDEYVALEETTEIFSDEATLAAIRRGLDDLAVAELTSLDDVRGEHATRDRTWWLGSSSPTPSAPIRADPRA
jgi:antitoxin YefM